MWSTLVYFMCDTDGHFYESFANASMPLPKHHSLKIKLSWKNARCGKSIFTVNCFTSLRNSAMKPMLAATS